jgi:hypothetical protein
MNHFHLLQQAAAEEWERNKDGKEAMMHKQCFVVNPSSCFVASFQLHFYRTMSDASVCENLMLFSD